MTLSTSRKPLKRYLLRIMAIPRFGRSRMHWQEWLPGLELKKPTSGVNGEIEYFGKPVGSLLPISGLASEVQKELTVIGSAPSIKQQNIDRLPENTAILLNGAIHLIPEQIARPFAIAIEDERFVWGNHKLIRQKILPGQVCFFSPPVLRALCEEDDAWLSDKRICLIDNVLKPYGANRRRLDELSNHDDVELAPTVGFSTNTDFGVFPGGTVAYTAFQIACNLAPECVGFAGVDLNNTASAPRFYEKQGNAAWSGIEKGLSHTTAAFCLGKAVAEAKGIKLLSYSPSSALQQWGFPYSSLLQSAG